jgi:hypothetical protein
MVVIDSSLARLSFALVGENARDGDTQE